MGHCGMKHNKDYQIIAKQGQYQRMSYTKVKCLLYEQNEPKTVNYKTRFSDNWIAQNVVERPATRSNGTKLFQVNDPNVAKPGSLAPAKKSNIKEMLQFKPPDDRASMSLIC